MNEKTELQKTVVKFAQQFGIEWLPKFNRVIESILETQSSLNAEGVEGAISSDSYTLQCARRQYMITSQLCGELWETLTNWKNATIPLFPDVDYDSILPETDFDKKCDFLVEESDGVVLMRTPFPLKRYAKRKTSSPALGELKKELISFLSQKESSFSLAGDNIFYFWYVYPKKENNQRWYFPDNDNYLIKPTIDTICEVFSIQDAGTDTYLFSATALCSDVPEGTYIFIVPQADKEHDFRRQNNAIAFIRNLSR